MTTAKSKKSIDQLKKLNASKKKAFADMRAEDKKNAYENVMTGQTFGRPTKCTEELTKKICELIEITPKGLQTIIAENDWMPETATIRRWVQTHENFRDVYAQAKKKQIETHINHTLIISDDVALQLDTVHPQKAGAYVQAAKLRIESRHKYAEMLEPSKYGVKAKTAEDDDKDKLANLTPEEAAIRVSAAFALASDRQKESDKK